MPPRCFHPFGTEVENREFCHYCSTMIVIGQHGINPNYVYEICQEILGAPLLSPFQPLTPRFHFSGRILHSLVEVILHQ